RSGGRDATGATDETTVLPPVRDAGRESARDADPADRVPRGIFRDEHPAGSVPERENERTRELPQVTDPHAPQQLAPDQQERSGRPSRRPRPDWAEETPLDDLPTLADELLGDHDDEGPASSGRGRRPRR
ncbi:dTMP kinase, partial [Streptomyces laculatispora]|nr:dTMP kinase [Streptomyces laculatispora]